MTLKELFDAVESVHGKTWNLWCTFDGKYVIQITVNKQNLAKHVDGLGDRVCLGPQESLEDLLKEAANYRFLIRINKKPEPPPDRYRYSTKKNGAKWDVYLDGTRFLVTCKTKTEAERFVEFQIAQIHRSRDWWDEEVLPLIAGKTEGVHYSFV